MHHRVEKLVIDIANAIEEIESFTKGKEFLDFQNDRGLQLIVERDRAPVISQILCFVVPALPSIHVLRPECFLLQYDC